MKKTVGAVTRIHKSKFHQSPMLMEMWNVVKRKSRLKTNYCPLNKRQFSHMDKYFRKHTLNTYGCGLEFFAVFLEDYFEDYLYKIGVPEDQRKHIMNTFIDMTNDDNVTPDTLDIGVKWFNIQIKERK